MIRGAQNFIYIETQYFMGSAFSWLKNDKTSCDHLVPAEIAQKIVEKIYNGERFVAYIVIPMFPEGDPTSAPIQEILYWQTNTIEVRWIVFILKLSKTDSNLDKHLTITIWN